MEKAIIEYFKNHDEFIKLQLHFLKQDYVYQSGPEYFTIEKVLNKEDFFIEKEFIVPDPKDQYSYLTEYIKEYFYKDYLPNIISKLSEDYLEGFYDYIREDYIDNQKERRKFLIEQRKYVESYYENLNQFSFLDNNLINALKIQIIEIQKVLNSPVLYNDKLLKGDKLSLIGWNETDLVTFFNFLRAQKVIDFLSDVELGRFLERNFCVENQDGQVMTLDSLNKRLNDLKNVNKLNDRSEKRLSDLFKKFSKY